MTADQLAVLAQAPCSSTMVGLGPPLAAVRVVVRAEATWLRGTTRAAMATARAGMMMRSRARCAARAMFIRFSLSGDDERRFGCVEGRYQASPLFRLCGGKLAVGYPCRYCTSVNGPLPVTPVRSLREARGPEHLMTEAVRWPVLADGGEAYPRGAVAIGP